MSKFKTLFNSPKTIKNLYNITEVKNYYFKPKDNIKSIIIQKNTII